MTIHLRRRRTGMPTQPALFDLAVGAPQPQPAEPVQPPGPAGGPTAGAPTTGAPTTGAPTAGGPTGAPATAVALASGFRVEVVRSKRRKKTVGAALVGDVLTVTVPWWMPLAEHDHWVEVMSRRFARRRQTERVDLTARARVLARRYGLHQPASVTWAGELSSRWGSCTPSTRSIRLCDRLAAFPEWVLDYVLVHELAHLHHGNHGPAFWELVHRYPRTERAIGYLMAKSADGSADLDDVSDDAI